MALTSDKNTVRFGAMHVDSPSPVGVKGTTKIYAGAGCCRDATGVAVPASISTTLKTIGVARKQYDNTGGADNAIVGEFDAGDYLFNNSTAGDLIAALDIGNDCYWVDDNTVAKTSNSSTRSIAGKVIAVNPTGFTGVVVRVGIGY